MACVILVALLVFGACSSADVSDQAERNRDKRAGAKGNGNGKGGAGKGSDSGGNNAPEEIEDAAGGGVTGEDAPQGFGGKDAPSGAIDPSLARASAAMDDAPNDSKRQGLPPDYAEATRGAIQGQGETVRFTMRFGGNVPSSVPKDHYMVIAFGVTGTKKDEGIAIGATCDQEGWHPYAGAKGDRQKFPGTFDVQGTEIVMEVPWSFIKGPRAFEWYASTGWYGQIANQTQWSFDSIPNGDIGKFPG